MTLISISFCVFGAMFLIGMFADSQIATIVWMRGEFRSDRSKWQLFLSRFKTRKPPAKNTRLGRICRAANYGIGIGLIGIVITMYVMVKS